jgi:uncharacterized RDD family membrane protein YckC
MEPINPYRSPETVDAPIAEVQINSPTRHVHGKIIHRYFAATADAVISVILALVLASMVPENLGLLQAAVLLGVWFFYFFLCELLLSSSIGKLFAGLVVVQLSGHRITWRQAAIRSFFRFLEVNPIFFGGLPAGACILLSSRRQRFGDLIAGTVVVPGSALRKAD